MEVTDNIEESDIIVNVNKTEKDFIVKITAKEEGDLGHTQALSGLLAGYFAACEKLEIDFAQFFADEFSLVARGNEETH